MIYDEWFPTVIGWADYPFYNELSETVMPNLNNIMNYDEVGRSYHNWHDDPAFSKLSKWIDNEVLSYCSKHNFYNKKLKCFECWSIDYPYGESNVAHAHTGSIVSVNFFLKSHIDDEGTRFKNPVTDMMNPMNLTVKDDFTIEGRLNEWTYNDCHYPPKEGRLLVFRSYLEHYTVSKKTNTKRIILSANYK